MRATVVAPAVAIFLLTGCTVAHPAPSSSPSMPTTPAPTSTPHVIDNESLPTVEKVMESLTSNGNDSGEPGVTFGALFAPGEQQFFENAAEWTPGPAAVRVACTTADGSDVAIAVTIGEADPIAFTAPCGDGEGGIVITRTEEQRIDISGPYRFTVDTTADASVAVGVVRLPPE